MASSLKRHLCEALRRQLAGSKGHPPSGSAILWNAFMALSRARTAGPVGPNAIAYSEIAAWSQLTRTPLKPHHVEILTAMDEVWMGHVYDRERAPEGVKTLPPRSKHALTPAMFDLAVG